MIEGENRTLTCNVSGGPVLTVAWTEVSSPSQSSGVMRYLTNISRYNAGEYKCEAANDCGNSSSSTLYSVSDYYLFNDDRVKICIKFQSVHLVAQFSLFAKCELLDSQAVGHSSHFSQACFVINKK